MTFYEIIEVRNVIIMNDQEKVMCTYCAAWHAHKDMTPLYEKGKSEVCYYCPRCVSSVKKNIVHLPFKHLFKFGEKGE